MGVSAECDGCGTDLSYEAYCADCGGSGAGGCDLAQCLHAAKKGCKKNAEVEHTGKYDSDGFPIFTCKEYLRNMEALKKKVFEDAGRKEIVK